ncbi:hypothetical protein HDU98_011416 [Podochytrium sp. JEL0797]|nr:hypothetical protein HDU98_011416 [Podochytrium sp. JEL0797]
MLSLAIISSSAALVAAQFTPGGQTQPGLPAGCVGSCELTIVVLLFLKPQLHTDHNSTQCQANHWYFSTPDPCKPDTIPMPGQQVYIKDELNFCINLPNPNSIILKNNFYNATPPALPTIAQGEGYVQSFCMGSYLTPGALPMPQNAIRSAHVVQKYAPAFGLYYQIWGTMDCDSLNINCTMSAPGAYDNGGQYDDGAYKSCGKEPYSGVDSTANPGMVHYIVKAGDGEFCMRVCEAGANVVGGPCDHTKDKVGCSSFMQVSFTDGFSFTGASGVVTTTSTFLPPSTATTAPSTGAASPGATSPRVSTTGTIKNSSKAAVLGVFAGFAAILCIAQFTPGGQTQPGLPAGCVGSYPNITICKANNWYIATPDPCYPLTTIPMPGQQVYIKDELNFCINLPNPNSIFLQNNFYNAVPPTLPTIVQAEGFVQSFCMGSYLTPGALPMPQYAIRSAHVVQKYAPAFGLYYQIWGSMDCGRLNINCTMSAPGAYDDGGQYDDGAYKSCGKEPYSGVDSTANPGMVHYVEMADLGSLLHPTLIKVLKVLFVPTGLNLRNLVWHGFVTSAEIPYSYIDLMVLLIRDTFNLNAIFDLEMNATWQLNSFDRHPNLTAFHDFPQTALEILHNSDHHLATLIEETRFVPDSHKPQLLESLDALQRGQELMFLFHAFPVLEHSLRCLFANVNNVPEIAVAHVDAYFSTLDGFGQRNKHQVLLDSMVVSTGLENMMLGLLRGTGGGVTGCLAVLLDFCMMEKGPGVRGKLCHALYKIYGRPASR